MQLEGKKALITGGSRGIGRAIAQAFAREGASVAINFAHNSEAARGTLETLEGSGHWAVKANLADPEAVGQLAQQIQQEWGALDILVNNAGVFLPHPVQESSYADWQEAWTKTLGVNLLGPANLIHQLVPGMIQQGGGRIINISSRGAFRGEPTHPAYGASKAGLNAMGQSLAQALGPQGIFIYTLAPGFIETDMTADILDSDLGEAIRAQSPLNRVGRPEELAATACFLAGGNAEYLTGCIIDVNGASYLRS
jgi:3-oxoacyl-[acyl-carrier protein] reductase